MKSENKKAEETNARSSGEQWWEVVRDQVGSLRFGAVQIVVHNSRVVQVERTERVRFDEAAKETPQLTHARHQ